MSSIATLATPTPDRIAEAIADAVHDALPYSTEVLDTIYDAVRRAVVTPLPRGSHLVLADGKRGVGVIAVNTADDVQPRFLSEFGDWVTVARDDSRVVIGP